MTETQTIRVAHIIEMVSTKLRKVTRFLKSLFLG